MSARRLAFSLGLAAAAVLAISVRLATRSQLSGATPVFDSDSAYHLRRARAALANFPRTILFDPLMNFPDGGVPIWPPLYDLSLAAPARVAHGAAATAREREAGARAVPLAFGVAAVVLAGLVAREAFGAAGGVLAAFFVALCPGHILWTQFGHTDQHAAESAVGLLALWTFLRRTDPARGGAARDAAAGVALALAVLFWQGAIYWGAIFAVVLLWEGAALGRDALRSVLLVLALPAAITGIATAAWLGPLRPPLTYVSFGFFQPLFLGALAGGTIALDTAIGAARGRLSKSSIRTRLVVLAGAAAVLLPFVAPLAGGLANGIGYVIGRTAEAKGRGGYVSYPAGWLRGIFETRPLLADGPALALAQLSGAFLLAPAAAIVWAARARRGPLPARHAALAVWAAVTLLLSLAQRLNVYYAAPLAALALLEALRLLDAGLTRFGAGVRIAARAAATVVLLLPMAPGLRRELSAVHVPGSDLFETLAWMRAKLPHAVDPYASGLLEIPPRAPGLDRARAVLGPWALGHLVLYEAELPVVANNFGYGFLDSIRFFLAENEAEALAIADARRAGWVIVTDLVPRMNDYAAAIGRPPYLAPGPGGGPQPDASYFRTMQSRLFDFDGAGARLPGIEIPPLARFRLVYRSRSAIARGGRWFPRWRVFEILSATAVPKGP